MLSRRIGVVLARRLASRSFTSPQQPTNTNKEPVNNAFILLNDTSDDNAISDDTKRADKEQKRTMDIVAKMMNSKCD